MKSNLALGLAALLAMGSAHAAATLSEWGAVASRTSSTCASDFCGADTDGGFLLDLSVDAISGGAGEASAGTATGTWPAPGSAQADGVVAGGLAVPLLTAGATSTADAWLAAQALVIQGYGYTGTVAETIELDWQLTGNVTNPDDDAVTGLSVFVGFFSVGDLGFPDVGSSPMDAFNLLAGLALADPENNFLEFTTPGDVVHGSTLSIDVNDGDQFYLAMGLMAAAGGAGAQAESLSTLTAAFRDTPALTPAIAAVPLPAPAWLFAPAVLGLGALARRRRPRET